MNLKEIKSLIDLIEDSKVTSILIEEDNKKIEIKKSNEPIMVQAQPQVQHIIREAQPAAEPQPAATPAAPASANAEEAGLVYIKSPMVGTFYSAPSPDAAAYVKAGDSIEKGATVCIIEAMKLFNEIESEFAGVVTKILVKNADPVEYGQNLFAIKPR